MGLSAYGKPKYYDLILNEILDVKNDGSTPEFKIFCIYL